MLGDFNVKVGREDIFKPTNGNEGLHKIYNNDNNNPKTDKSTMFPTHNIHKFTWTSPDEKTHNQTAPILRDRRRHSSILDD
jgi:hypothetical protein